MIFTIFKNKQVVNDWISIINKKSNLYIIKFIEDYKVYKF